MSPAFLPTPPTARRYSSATHRRENRHRPLTVNKTHKGYLLPSSSTSFLCSLFKTCVFLFFTAQEEMTPLPIGGHSFVCFRRHNKKKCNYYLNAGGYFCADYIFLYFFGIEKCYNYFLMVDRFV